VEWISRKSIYGSRRQFVRSPAGECGFRAVLDARRSERIKVAITMGRVQQLAINWR